MADHSVPASFDADDRRVVTWTGGQLVHEAAVAQMERLREQLYVVTDGVWCVVGNGLSNQTFVEGPEGLIVIDTGESNEEMIAALQVVREHTSAPVAAVIYTHFHYCNGTAALFDGAVRPDGVEIWGHAGIEGNLRRMATEVAPAAGRGLVHQFGMALPHDGEDGLVGCGLGRFYRNPAHGRGTPGHLPATRFVDDLTSTHIAGLDVTMSPAPSDADDNLNIFFPSLGLCVNNIVWPALFNVYAIRGEEYRDPRVLLNGIDEIADHDPEHLVCAHGPPVSGIEEVRAGVRDARDAIQFLWDQTVRGINRGLTIGELIVEVQLPDRFERSYLTQQHYGLAEHHVRQIHAGLRGWFDGNEADLFPLPTVDRAARLIDGFGGRAAVAEQAAAALGEDEVRWALELATWLVRSEIGADGRADGGSPSERGLLASVLRTIARRTTAANIRNWCLTRALDLDGEIDLSRHRGPRFGRSQVLAQTPEATVHGLRVALDPAAAANVDVHLRFDFHDPVATCGLWVRGGVAVPTDGGGAEIDVGLTLSTWADVLSGRTTWSEAVSAGDVQVESSAHATVASALRCFDVESLAR